MFLEDLSLGMEAARRQNLEPAVANMPTVYSKGQPKSTLHCEYTAPQAAPRSSLSLSLLPPPFEQELIHANTLQDRD